MKMQKVLFPLFAVFLLFVSCASEEQQESDSSVFKPYSELPSDLTDEQYAVLSVIHQDIFERLWKQGERLGVNAAAYNEYSYSGPEGGTAKHLILYNSALDENTDVYLPKMHLFIFDQYKSGGLTFDGTFGFVFGYEYHVSSRTGYIYETDSIWQDMDAIVLEVKNNSFVTNTALYNELNSLPLAGELNKIQVTGTYEQTVDFSFAIANMKNMNDPDGYHWRDELWFSYDVAGRNVTLLEYTLPGKYQRAFSTAQNELTQLPHSPSTTLYEVSGAQGGVASRSVSKVSITGGYEVTETFAFDDYGAEDVVLNGSVDYTYETDSGGNITAGGSYSGNIQITGYAQGEARHAVNVYDNGSNYQISNSYQVSDYPEIFERVTIFLPVGFGS